MKNLTYISLGVLVVILLAAYYLISAGTSLTIVAAGDIAKKDGRQVEVANLISKLNPDKVLVLGDTAYDAGTTQEFATLYDPSWGVFKNKTAPSPGNHEYKTPNAAGYYDYFGELAGPDRRGYYSFDIDNWHFISLNSEAINEAQLTWLNEDLSKTSQPCILAYWHVPLFSSGSVHGSNPKTKVFWTSLFAKGADLVLNGHEHFYERYEKLNPEGFEESKGIRQIIVGTGGAPQYGFGNTKRGSEVRLTGNYGVLELTLKDNSYVGEFKDINQKVLDRIEGQCN
jgi:hypothetical protein